MKIPEVGKRAGLWWKLNEKHKVFYVTIFIITGPWVCMIYFSLNNVVLCTRPQLYVMDGKHHSESSVFHKYWASRAWGYALGSLNDYRNRYNMTAYEDNNNVSPEIRYSDQRGFKFLKIAPGVPIFFSRLSLNQPANIIRHMSTLGNIMSSTCYYPFMPPLDVPQMYHKPGKPTSLCLLSETDDRWYYNI